MSVAVFGRWIDTGYITWKQPDGTEFTARLWGDEFFSWMETNDGYRITRDFDDWYYYAILDASGEFSPSNSKVGIDNPLTGSLGLERSSGRIAEIEVVSTVF